MHEKKVSPFPPFDFTQHWHTREVCGVQTIVKYECCTGFAENDDSIESPVMASDDPGLLVDNTGAAATAKTSSIRRSRGCPVTLPLLSLQPTLQALHFDAFDAAAVQQFKTGNRGIAFTLFVPSNEAIRRESEVRDS